MTDVNYEKAVLCVALEVPEAFADIVARLTPDDFGDKQHQSLWHGLKLMLRDGYERAEAVKIQELIDRGTIACDPEYVKSLRGYLPDELGWYDYRGYEDWTDRVADRSRLRAVETQLGRAMNAAREPGATADEVLGDVLDIIVAESNQRDISGFRPISESFNEFEALFEDWLKGQAGNKVPTGFADLDAQLGGGLPRGNLTVIGGRPGSFKTALAFQIAQNVAERLQQEGSGSIAFASLEMTKTELIKRAVCADAHVNSIKLEQGDITKAQERRLRQAMEKIRGLESFKVYDGLATSDFLHYQTLLMMARDDVHLLVIDFAELIADRGSSEVERVSKIFRVARDIAKVRNIPVVLLSQLNRSVEEEPSKIPGKHHLKLGGEDVPALVLMTYYPYGYEQLGEHVRVPKHFGYQQRSELDQTADVQRKNMANRGRLYAVLAKNRFGPTGEVKLNVVPEWTLIKDYDPRSESEGVVKLVARTTDEISERGDEF